MSWWSRYEVRVAFSRLQDALAEELVEALERIPLLQRVIVGRRSESYLAGVERGREDAKVAAENRARHRYLMIVAERLRELEATGPRPRATTVLRQIAERMHNGYVPRPNRRRGVNLPPRRASGGRLRETPRRVST